MFLLGMERPKKAIFGCFRPIMGLFFIEYEGFGPKTCTNYVGILGQTSMYFFGLIMVSYRYGKAKKGHFWLFSAIFALSITKRNDYGAKNYIECLT